MILEVKNITKHFDVERGILKTKFDTVCALDNVSFSLDEFTTLGIVGESGSGKTTLAKIIVALIPQTSGEIIFNTAKITNFRKDVQIIFQNPYNSLNPKMRIRNVLFEPLIIHRIVENIFLAEKAKALLQAVGLEDSALNRYPREFSGGQRQRICIARALATEPKFIVLDEPISSLDLTIQAKLLDLFIELKEKFHLTYIFITHNLGIIKYIADSVIVMHNARIVEQGKVSDIFKRPSQPYTQTLLEAAK